MTPDHDQIFEISSMGKLYRKSLALFAHQLEDDAGNAVQLEALAVGQPFFVVFQSGTGWTRTSAKRIS